MSEPKFLIESCSYWIVPQNRLWEMPGQEAEHWRPVQMCGRDLGSWGRSAGWQFTFYSNMIIMATSCCCTTTCPLSIIGFRRSSVDNWSFYSYNIIIMVKSCLRTIRCPLSSIFRFCRTAGWQLIFLFWYHHHSKKLLSYNQINVWISVSFISIPT